MLYNILGEKRMEGKERKIKLTLFFSLFTAVLCTISPLLAQASRLYVGYFYFGPPGGNAPWGVYSRILTINPAIPTYYAHLQWVTIMLSYDRYYWLQTGYYKDGTKNNPVFYWEVFDSSQKISYKLSIGPTTGATYSYTIVHAQKTDPKLWDFLIRDSSGQTIFNKEISADPYVPIDLQAFVETTTSYINVGGTHFSYLSYYNGQSWLLWNRHAAYVDPPYWLDQVSHYEFKAGGGGY
ncbi:MAG: hypothetical protein ACP5KW_08300 [Thermoproteota archaeon]